MCFYKVLTMLFIMMIMLIMLFSHREEKEKNIFN